MEKILKKKVNELLNKKEVRCINCNKLVDFKNEGEFAEKPYSVDLKEYKCLCGINAENIANQVYVRFKDKSVSELTKVLKDLGLIEIDVNKVPKKILYNRLDFVDGILQDRTFEDDVEDINDSLEDRINKFISNVGITEKAKRIAGKFKEIDWEYFCENLLVGEWWNSPDWRDGRMEFQFEEYSGKVYLNDSKDLMLIEIYSEDDLEDTAVFDRRSVNRIISIEDELTDNREVSKAIGILMLNLIKRLYKLPEEKYKMGKVDIKELAESIRKQLISQDEIIVFGQDENAHDWVLEGFSTNGFTLINSRGSDLNFEITEESENFLKVSTTAKTVGNRFNGSHGGCLVDKCNYKIIDFIEQEFAFIEQVKDVIGIFECLKDEYTYLGKITNDLHKDLEEVKDYMSEWFTEEEMIEVSSLEYYKELSLNKEDYMPGDVDFLSIEVRKLANLVFAELGFFTLLGYYRYDEKYDKELDLITEKKEVLKQELLTRCEMQKIEDIIRKYYAEDTADILIDTLELYDEEEC